MNNKYSSNQKLCGTCSFWMGQRTTNQGRTLTEVVPDTKGDCHEGGRLQRQKHNTGTCSKWQKWGGVK